MSFSIGPISLEFLEAHSWDARRQTEIVSIPFGRQTGFTTGAELVSYNLSGAFHADTIAEAKIMRRQLNELFNNPHIDFEYIQFDGDDDEELSGWFLLDQISTSILPGVLGDYPFTASVRRLGKFSTHLFGTYWTSNPYTNDYALTGREWVAAPNSLGSSYNDNRPGDGGENYIIVGPSPLTSPIIYRNQPTVSDYYDMACQVYVGTSSLGPAGVLNGSSKVEVFNVDHIAQFTSFGSLSNEYIIVSNGLVAIYYDTVAFSSGVGMCVYDPAASPNWVSICGITYQDASSTKYQVDYQTRPIFEKISRDEIVFRVVMSIDAISDQSSIQVRYKLRRGTYFVDVSLSTTDSGVGANSYLSSVGLSALSSASNHAATTTSAGQFGYLYTETASPAVTFSSSRLEIGYAVSTNSETRFGVFAAPPSLPTGTTLANLGNEYIANMTQKPVLIDPRWL